ncbi:hypothetical protein GQ53DRAFT_666400 [Thozetella sp. PMI_491]|nr:hypothetical protein GQ53DRAFT_666400 [Thozetella sp. PMI_491]
MRPSTPPREGLLEQPVADGAENGFGLGVLSLEKAKGAAGGLSFGKMAMSFLENLKPEIFNRRRGSPRRPLSSTAWLDGLRGWAAFIVCFVHLSVYTHSHIESCYAYEVKPEDTEIKFSPASWFLIRYFFSGGHLAVMVFFTISGYVLTRRQIQLLHEGRRDDFLEAVNSSMIRRAVRLFFPVVCSTFTFAMIWHIFGIYVPFPPIQDNIFLEIWHWMGETLQFFYFFRNGFLFTNYNGHTWTIPVELRGSMFVFVWLFALHRISHRIRILMTLGMAIYLAVFTTGAWYAAFFAGMFTCELDLLAAEGSVAEVRLPWDGLRKKLNGNTFLRQYVLHFVLLCGLYLGNQPSNDFQKKAEVLGTCPGWMTLSHLIPPVYNDDKADKTHRWFFLFWASWMLLASIKEIAWVRRFFELPFSQYLGKVSFALYLIHGPMIGILSERLFFMTGVKKPVFPDEYIHWGSYYNKWHDASWWPFPDGGPPGLEPNFLVCVAISIPIFLYVAELGTKFFDAPSVPFAKAVYKKLLSLK